LSIVITSRCGGDMTVDISDGLRFSGTDEMSRCLDSMNIVYQYGTR
jgi:hypothetical protein